MHNRCLADTRTALPTALGLALLLAPACGGGVPLHARDGAVDASPADGPANADAPAAGNSQPDAASPAARATTPSSCRGFLSAGAWPRLAPPLRLR